MNPTDFGDPMTFGSSSTMTSCSVFLVKYLTNSERIFMKYVADIHNRSLGTAVTVDPYSQFQFVHYSD